MTDPNPFRLWTTDGFREDPWTHGTAEALGEGASVILPLTDYLALESERRAGANASLGVLVSPAEDIAALEPHLGDLALIALAFPSFSDGRSFSKAELLRSRFGYTGPLRATGQVLVDQLPHMLRLGFTEFEVSEPVLIRRLEDGHTGGLPLAYQPTGQAADEPPAGLGRQYSWRRVPRQ